MFGVKIHPLIYLVFFLSFTLSTLMVGSISELAGNSILFLFLLFIYRNHVKYVLGRLKPFLIYFLVMGTLYIAISVFVTQDTIYQILFKGGFAMIKLFLMVAIMSLYLVSASSNRLLTSLRTLWNSAGKSWLWVDNFFLYLEMTLRFYPTFQLEWDQMRRSRRALGIDSGGSRIARLKDIVQNLPGLVILSLRRAGDIALAMQLRGYGNQVPRGVASPITFSRKDLVILSIILVFFTGLNRLAAI